MKNTPPKRLAASAASPTADPTPSTPSTPSTPTKGACSPDKGPSKTPEGAGEAFQGFVGRLLGGNMTAQDLLLERTMFEPSEKTRIAARGLAPDIHHLLPGMQSLRFWRSWLLDMNAVQDEDKSFFFDIIMGVLVEDILAATGVDFTQYVSREYIAEQENHLHLLRTNRAYAERWRTLCRNAGMDEFGDYQINRAGFDDRDDGSEGSGDGFSGPDKGGPGRS